MLVQGPQVFPGYVDPRRDQGVLTNDHWLITGDIGYPHPGRAAGAYGSRKDLIVRSGHNIDPAAIEDVANEFPGVQMSSAVGMPDAYAGEVPILFCGCVPGPGDRFEAASGAYRAKYQRASRQTEARHFIGFTADHSGGQDLQTGAARLARSEEKVRAEIDRIFGATSKADIQVDKDDKLNTLITVSVDCDDAALIQKLAESLSSLPQIYRIEKSFPGPAEGMISEGQMEHEDENAFVSISREIVFAVFAALFLAFSILLRGFLTPENMLTLLQNVAVLGILGLAHGDRRDRARHRYFAGCSVGGAAGTGAADGAGRPLAADLARRGLRADAPSSASSMDG